jgi:type IV pilus biogenesis protein CpaD/CtpE
MGILAGIVLGLATLVGCESPWPMGASRVDQYMGDAHRDNIARMTENPYASHENTAAPTVDSETAEVVLDRYYESQKSPDKARDLPSIIQIDAN